MSEKEKDDYVVPFKGAKLKQSQATRVGFSIIFGFGAAFLLVPTIGDNSPLITKILVISAAVLGFIFYRGQRHVE